MTFGTSSPLPDLDPQFAKCFAEVVPAPKQKVISSQDAFDIIGTLHQSDLEKTLCGRRLIKFYNDLKARR